MEIFIIESPKFIGQLLPPLPQCHCVCVWLNEIVDHQPVVLHYYVDTIVACMSAERTKGRRWMHDVIDWSHWTGLTVNEVAWLMPQRSIETSGESVFIVSSVGRWLLIWLDAMSGHVKNVDIFYVMLLCVYEPGSVQEAGVYVLQWYW